MMVFEVVLRMGYLEKHLLCWRKTLKATTIDCIEIDWTEVTEEELRFDV
jgi:hypothetical protein